MQYDDFASDIEIVSLQGSYPETEQYLSLINESDRALEQFLTELETFDEKTIVCFFGDHQPFVEQGFVDELYGKSANEYTIEELQKRYCVPYVVTANYEFEEESYDNISANYLGIKLLKMLGLEMTGYYKFIDELYGEYPVINANGYMNSQEEWFGWEEQPISDSLLKYSQLQYGIMFDGVVWK